jgi:hypothetical protein
MAVGTVRPAWSLLFGRDVDVGTVSSDFETPRDQCGTNDAVDRLGRPRNCTSGSRKAQFSLVVHGLGGGEACLQRADWDLATCTIFDREDHRTEAG